MDIKTIIFDFDGVIIDSNDVKTKAFSFLFQDYPEHIGEIIRFHRVHGGLSRFDKFEFIFKNILHKKLSKIKKNELGEKFADFVFDEVVKCPFIEGALEFLNGYYKRLSFFIVSGTPQDELRLIVKARKLEEYFIEVFGAPGKKNAYNAEIIKKYRISPGHILVVGDSIDDYLGAKEAGLKFVGRITGANPFKGLQTQALIHNLFDLEKVINGE